MLVFLTSALDSSSQINASAALLPGTSPDTNWRHGGRP
jgi:hypothetical protein